MNKSKKETESENMAYKAYVSNMLIRNERPIPKVGWLQVGKPTGEEDLTD